MSRKDSGTVSTVSPASEVERFLEEVAGRGREPGGPDGGRLVFAMDATASRQPTWDLAAQLQGGMFAAASGLGRFQIQLCFYRGMAEFRAGPWLSDPARLTRLMTSVSCRAGRTQIARVLQHTINETRMRRVGALVFVGDCAEESLDTLAALAGDLGLFGVPAFVFQEGADPIARIAFKEIARLTRGAYCAFDAGSADMLRSLLAAVAVYVAGGRTALLDWSAGKGDEVKRIASQISGR